ncbi:NUDIX hydrolase [Polyangium jinanense]|uniref:CoA pyrophosphatase n=1 Tax=Polyangium jinanense TaxID=2829994 RepID=A0A9X3XFA1_9BACT|nr:CoA pyrophosphatase [Polyangium jinanense]MDC3959162.1 CoA pyrophosphatase [Polyangium jinanense]MDC3987618.1 CoA pyrophosphatase [Polyangium jinanense]
MSTSYDLAAIAARLTVLDLVSEAATTERQAAVAAILRAPRSTLGGSAPTSGASPPNPQGHEAEVLLIRRSERQGDPWSGQMAFPGGRREPADPSLYHTALRETEEEIGLDLAQHGRFLARLADVPAVARARRVGMTITPFVFALDEPDLPPFQLSAEVAEVVWAPIGPMARGQNATRYSYNHEGNVLDMPAFAVEQRIVWGLTYRMLEMLFEVLGGR